MDLQRSSFSCLFLIVGVVFGAVLPASGQEAKLKKAMEILPKQRGVDFDRPSASELKNYRLEETRDPMGYLVTAIVVESFVVTLTTVAIRNWTNGPISKMELKFTAILTATKTGKPMRTGGLERVAPAGAGPGSERYHRFLENDFRRGSCL